MLHLQVLGPLQVTDGSSEDLTPAGGREQLCLAILALVAPQPVSTERLAAELYRDRDTSDPRNAVQAAISRLRRALGRSAGSIETTGTGYRLVDVTLDIDAAEQLLESALGTDDLARSQELLDEALALWRGPTLDGLTADSVDAERVRIDGLAADAEEVVAQRQLDVGADHRLLASLESAVARHPLRERRWEQLMLALYRDGRQADALRAFQRARAILADQLGLEPGRDLTLLERRILDQDPSLLTDADAASAAAAAGPKAAHLDPSTEMAPLPTGTVSLVLCDVEGSVKRWETDPVHTAADIALLHEIWSEATESIGGRVVKSTGDGMLSVFETAAAAVGASVAALARQEQTSLSVRVAIYSGSVQPVDDDYRGPVVNRCARLLDLAHGGQILTSSVTAELARPDLPPTISLTDLGNHWLRDVSEPVSVVQIGGPGLRSRFGPLDSQGPARIPRLRGSLLGRDDLIDEVVARVGDRPLVSLLGPGGIGKTSTALATAWRLVDTRAVTFVDLARVTDPGAVVDRIVQEMVLPEHDADRDPNDRLIDRLRLSTDLVVIDNAEHLLDPVAELLDEVLSFELKGSFLVTTRQPLGLAGETIIGIPPLPLPGSDDDLDATSRSPSVQLFMERVRATRPNAELSPGLLPVVAHICRRLDGIPLAIELAAGRSSVLAIDDIAARLDDQLRLLRQLQSTRERRHRSLEAVVGWSVDQLSPSARELFSRLSVMAGGFDAAGAEHLLHHCGTPSEGVLDDLDELVNASLLVADQSDGRLRMLEPIRQFSAAELVERDAEESTRRAHVAWLTELVVDAHHRRDETRSAALTIVDTEADNLAAAIRWIGEAQAVELIDELVIPSSWWFLTRSTPGADRLLSQLEQLVDREQEPRRWASVIVALAIATAAHPRSDVADTVLDAIAIFDAEDHPDRGLFRVAAAFAFVGQPDPAPSKRLLAEAERLVSSDDRWAMGLVDMASMTIEGFGLSLDRESADPERALRRGERASAAFRALGDTWPLAITLSELGRIRSLLGDFEAAERHYLESISAIGDDSDFRGHHYVLTDLGRMASMQGDHERAAGYHHRALEIAERDGHPGCIALALAGKAHAAVARGDDDEAVVLYTEALDLSRRSAIIELANQEWQAALEELLAKS